MRGVSRIPGPVFLRWSMWAVEFIRKQKVTLRVFDDPEEASDFAASLKRRGVSPEVWEL